MKPVNSWEFITGIAASKDALSRSQPYPQPGKKCFSKYCKMLNNHCKLAFPSSILPTISSQLPSLRKRPWLITRKSYSNYLGHRVASYLHHSCSELLWTVLQAAILTNKTANIHRVKVHTLSILRYKGRNSLVTSVLPTSSLTPLELLISQSHTPISPRASNINGKKC